MCVSSGVLLGSNAHESYNPTYTQSGSVDVTFCVNEP